MSATLPPRDSSLRNIFDLEDYLLLAAVVGLPWAFGGVQIWAFRTAALLIVAAATVAVFRDGLDGLFQRRRSAWLIPAFLLLLWSVVQIVPLPAAALRVLSPAADGIYAATFPGYPGRPADSIQSDLEQMALERVPEVDGLVYPDHEDEPLTAEAGGRWTGWRSLSLKPDSGSERVFWFLAMLIAFLLVRERCRDPQTAEAYRKVLFALFFALAVFGLIYVATSNGRLYWVRPTLESARPFGPYVNPTNFAGVMELAVPWLAGYSIYSWYTRPMSTPLRETRIPFLFAATTLCLLAAIATASKAAAALTISSLIVLSVLAVRGTRRRILLLLGVILLSAAITPVLLYVPLGERLREFVDATGGDVSQVDRVITWQASTEMLADYPITGSGFGSFSDVFPAYLPAGEYRRWSHVHNDYLELALEGGAIAVLLSLWLVFGFWRRLLGAMWRSGAQRIPDLAFVGLGLGILSLSVHAFFDFNHQIPANALLFVALGAVAVARVESAERVAS